MCLASEVGQPSVDRDGDLHVEFDSDLREYPAGVRAVGPAGDQGGRADPQEGADDPDDHQLVESEAQDLPLPNGDLEVQVRPTVQATHHDVLLDGRGGLHEFAAAGGHYAPVRSF